jgi:hypothetical protein
MKRFNSQKLDLPAQSGGKYTALSPQFCCLYFNDRDFVRSLRFLIDMCPFDRPFLVENDNSS